MVVEQKSGRSSSILVIDDNPQIRQLLSEYLTDKGFSVAIAETGMAGINQYAESEPDLIITDIVMPDMEGVELVKMIRERNQEIPIIVMSGGGSSCSPETYLKYARKFGASEQLAKPFELDVLLSLIRKYL